MRNRNRPRLPLNALRAFEAVAHHLNFGLGARSLHVTQSAVSRHIAALEAMLGRPLFVRRARGVSLTGAGATLFPVVTRCFDAIEDTLDEIGGRRHLQIHMPPAFLRMVGMPFIRDFQVLNPDVSLDVVSTLGTGLPVDIVDLAIVFDRPRTCEEVRDLLWEIRLTPVCSPATASEWQARGMEQMLRSDDLLHVRIQDEPRNILWDRFARELGFQLEPGHGLMFEDMTLAIEFAEASSGVALADVDMYDDRLKEGSLVAPFPEMVATGYGYYLQLDPEKLKDQRVLRFRSSIIARFKQAEHSLPS